MYYIYIHTHTHTLYILCIYIYIIRILNHLLSGMKIQAISGWVEATFYRNPCLALSHGFSLHNLRVSCNISSNSGDIDQTNGDSTC